MSQNHSYQLLMHHLHLLYTSIFYNAVIISCLSQGDRGFDGLPGLPGDKGHRVSQEQITIKMPYTLYTVLIVVVVNDIDCS